MTGQASSTGFLSPARLLSELAEPVEALLERHIAMSTEWYPHELIPWKRLNENPSDVSFAASSRASGVKSALLVNLLTEDNLPYYYAALRDFGFRDGAWGEWSRRWTAEEGRHATVIRDYILASSLLEPRGLEQARMASMSAGFEAAPRSLPEAVVYATLQELATRCAHRNTGAALCDPAGYEVMRRVAADENLHFLFYRDLASELLQRYPSAMMIAIERQVSGFKMPGQGIPRFRAHAFAIASAGIYDLGIHLRHVLMPVLGQAWNLDALEGLTGEAEGARGRLNAYLQRLEGLANRLGRAQGEGGRPADGRPPALGGRPQSLTRP